MISATTTSLYIFGVGKLSMFRLSAARLMHLCYSTSFMDSMDLVSNEDQHAHLWCQQAFHLLPVLSIGKPSGGSLLLGMSYGWTISSTNNAIPRQHHEC
ncbi:predicted protein [Lichtheimia corymbifera JMRC:FSU:9682]|uniref:Uncharacterized protein n=1 Tax=Lichtheimia corymbifera JMRC:FSU:9682 TaxID=1263082 RepID=A0A068SFL1_9FUNG|nr:predicted protein [Lichtheimia corymbifera JMRC:FSU:9682]CDH61430.1 predicted protein [Lichtheimia corymbifera JMRC:FSU:9682]